MESAGSAVRRSPCPNSFGVGGAGRKPTRRCHGRHANFGTSPHTSCSIEVREKACKAQSALQQAQSQRSMQSAEMRGGAG